MKQCFGKLDEVFPMGEEGLREVVPSCFECPERTACLKTALQSKEGLGLRKENLDRSPARGFIDRVKRWSERKYLSRQMEEKEKEDRNG